MSTFESAGSFNTLVETLKYWLKESITIKTRVKYNSYLGKFIIDEKVEKLNGKEDELEVGILEASLARMNYDKYYVIKESTLGVNHISRSFIWRRNDAWSNAYES